jgi:hypothetical protein
MMQWAVGLFLKGGDSSSSLFVVILVIDIFITVLVNECNFWIFFWLCMWDCGAIYNFWIWFLLLIFSSFNIHFSLLRKTKILLLLLFDF